jgi:hypothetical protein
MARRPCKCHFGWIYVALVIFDYFVVFGCDRKLKKRADESASSSSAVSGTNKFGSSSSSSSSAQDDEPVLPQEVTGTGRITSSAGTVQGHGTKFMSELEPGDASKSSNHSVVMGARNYHVY